MIMIIIRWNNYSLAILEDSASKSYVFVPVSRYTSNLKLDGAFLFVLHDLTDVIWYDDYNYNIIKILLVINY